MGAREARHKYSGADFSAAARVELAIGSSPFAVRAIGVGALSTLAVVAAVPIAGVAKVALCSWVAAAAFRSLRRVPVAWLRTDTSRDIEVRFADGRFALGTVVDGSFVAPWLTVIHWRPAGSRWTRTILLLPDMVEAAAFRRLRVLLRWCAAL